MAAPGIPPIELSYQDLVRHEETLKTPLRRALETGRMDLAPAPAPDKESSDPLVRAVTRGRAIYDEKHGRLVVPLIEGGRALGLLLAGGVAADQLPPAVSAFLSSIIEASLEMVRLRLAAFRDPLTGLANEAALDEALENALARLDTAKTRGRPALDGGGPQGGVALVAFKPVDLTGILERFGRRFGDAVLTEAGRALGAANEALCLARLGGTFLVLVQGGAAAAGEAHARLAPALAGLELSDPAGKPWRGAWAAGAAVLAARTWEAGDHAGEAAALLKSRALTAVGSALRAGIDDLLYFGEIVDRAGRLREVLPLDRVVIDLGRTHGLGEGERFAVVGDGPEAPVKAEVVVTNVESRQAVAEVVSLGDPTRGLRPGDRLRRMGLEAAARGEGESERVVKVGGREVRVLWDEATGLASHRSFMALFSALGAAGSPFAAGLIRGEGLEGMREVMGLVGVDALMKSLAAAARAAFPSSALLGRFAPDTLAVLLPETGTAELKQLTEELLKQVAAEASERALRGGVAGHPTTGFAAADVLDNAAKALVHAGFLDPGAVVVFDAVSLNISGDALFAQGRMAEAVAEYEKALGISPEEPNVLNSLGVCYGHLGEVAKAVDYFRRALAVSSDDYMAHFNLGYAFMRQGRLGEARAHLERSLELEPENADALFQLGRLAQGDGRLAEAVDLLTRAAERPDCRRAVHRHLGEVLAAAGKLGEAEEAFNRAVKVGGGDAAALTGLAELYLGRGANLEIALSLASRAREIEPGTARHLRVMAQALSDLGRLDQAAAELGQGASRFPEDPFLALQLGRVEAARGQHESAREQLSRALALEPNLEAARAALEELAEKPA